MPSEVNDQSTKTAVKRHPLAIAWDEWLASDEGDQCRQANTLAHNTNVYLENRLHRAFDAGAAARPGVSDADKEAIAIAILEAVNFDTSLPMVRDEIEVIKAILTERLGK